MQSVPTWIWLVSALVAAPMLFYAFQVGRRKKDYVRFRVRRLTVAMVFYVGGIFLLLKLGYGPVEAIMFGFVLSIAAGLFFVPRPERKRRIPTHVRRAVIERDLKGAPFDPSLHQIDHIVPFSKGGDNSLCNLRVVAKTENLRRGARMPRLKDLI
jgi:hypothetical protein